MSNPRIDYREKIVQVNGMNISIFEEDDEEEASVSKISIRQFRKIAKTPIFNLTI